MHTITPLKKVNASIRIASDKSISHRMAIFSAFYRAGRTKIISFLKSDDTLATLRCLKKIGVKFSFDKEILFLDSKNLSLPKQKKINLFAQESGTTMRVLTGLLSAQNSHFVFKAGPYLAKRPMGRIVYPLRKMGAQINGNLRESKEKKPEIYPPLEINPPFFQLKGKKHNLKIASAQVKSAILLAGLSAQGETVVTEPFKSRDHTERMLKAFGAKIKISKNQVTLSPGNRLDIPKNLFVPSDFSSAAFFLVLGLLLKKSQIRLKKVNINPTRCGLLYALKKMGADISLKNQQNEIEPYADIIVKSSQLKGITVGPSLIPSMIDEVPIFCVAAAFARGKTEIKGVKELTIKETDRVKSMVSNLKKAGVNIQSQPYRKDNLKIIIKGCQKYSGTEFKSYADHRTAMSMIIFALSAQSPSKIDNLSCINKSYPDFISVIKSLRR